MKSMLNKGTLAATLAATTALTGMVQAQDAKTIQIATHYNETQMGPLLECFGAYEAENPGI